MLLCNSRRAGLSDSGRNLFLSRRLEPPKKSATVWGCAEVPPKEEDFGGVCSRPGGHQHKSIMPNAAWPGKAVLLLRGRDFLTPMANKTKSTLASFLRRAGTLSAHHQNRHLRMSQDFAGLAAEQNRGKSFASVRRHQHQIATVGVAGAENRVVRMIARITDG